MSTSVYKCKKTTTGLLAQTRLPFDWKKISSEVERLKSASCVCVFSVMKDIEREKMLKVKAFNDDTRNNSNQHLKRKPPIHDVDFEIVSISFFVKPNLTGVIAEHHFATSRYQCRAPILPC